MATAPHTGAERQPGQRWQTGSADRHTAAARPRPNIARFDRSAGDPSWTGVASLGLGIFAIVLSEFLPASLLPALASDLGASEGAAGQAVSITALAAAGAALLIAVVLPRADRRRVMIGLTGLAAVSDGVVALAPNLALLLTARVLLGVALGGFWAMATAMAAHLVAPGQVGRALTLINCGVAAATVVAVPLGAWLAGVWGWRSVFLLAAGAALLALGAQAAALPAVPPAGATGLRALGSVLNSRHVLAGLLAILLVFAGHFGGFTYVRAAAQGLSGIDDAGFVVLLVVFGVAGLVGTVVAGPVADRYPGLGMLLFPVGVGLGMLLVDVGGASRVGLYLAGALWGLGFGGVPTTVLSWAARTRPARLEQIGGLVVTVCNLGVALGASVGGLLLQQFSIGAPLLAGALGAVGGGTLLVALRRR